MTLHFRSATAFDADAVAALHAASWQRAYRGIMTDAYLDGPVVAERLALWRKRLAVTPNGDSSLWVRLVLRHDTVIGFACVLLDQPRDGTALLDNLHIDAGYHGQGLGRALLAQAAEWLTQQRPTTYTSLELFVFTANTPARRFYEQLGARVIEEYSEPEPDGSLIPALRYAWRDVTVLFNNS